MLKELDNDVYRIGDVLFYAKLRRRRETETSETLLSLRIMR